jgi:hypothetical protein
MRGPQRPTRSGDLISRILFDSSAGRLGETKNLQGFAHRSDVSRGWDFHTD